MDEAGHDVTAMLPYLSRYMGHATIESTLLLHPHLAGLHARLRRHHAASQSLLPQVGFE